MKIFEALLEAVVHSILVIAFTAGLISIPVSIYLLIRGIIL